jgi:mycothiol S-conjugate amidase
MERARDILGVTQDWLGFVDSGWPEPEYEGGPKPPLPEGCFGLVPVEDGARPLIRLIRSFRPHVMTTYDEFGGYPHPDHIQCHNISVYAYEKASDPDYEPELGPAWQVSKLYYHHGFNRPKAVALHEAMLEHGLESHYAERLERWTRDETWDARVTTHVPCADYFGVRDQALLAHATQIDPDSWWFATPRELEKKVWPTEDYELARSVVETSLPEDDLFAGITTDVGE